MFADGRLARDCASERACVRRFGVNGRRVQRRLQELQAAEVLSDMRNAPGRLHPLSGNRAGEYAVSILEPFRLILEPADDPIPRTDDGTVNTDAVRSVRILEVTNYHDR
ncbi:MAG: killer suppression protein [Chloroflexota bacterium]